jgi:hypothetical protein
MFLVVGPVSRVKVDYFGHAFVVPQGGYLSVET